MQTVGQADDALPVSVAGNGDLTRNAYGEPKCPQCEGARCAACGWRGWIASEPPRQSPGIAADYEVRAWWPSAPEGGPGGWSTVGWAPTPKMARLIAWALWQATGPYLIEIWAARHSTNRRARRVLDRLPALPSLRRGSVNKSDG